MCRRYNDLKTLAAVSILNEGITQYGSQTSHLFQEMEYKPVEQKQYIYAYEQDLPEVEDETVILYLTGMFMKKCTSFLRDLSFSCLYR